LYKVKQLLECLEFSMELYRIWNSWYRVGKLPGNIKSRIVVKVSLKYQQAFKKTRIVDRVSLNYGGNCPVYETWPYRSLIALPNSVCLSVWRTRTIHYDVPITVLWSCSLTNWTHNGDRIPACSRDVLNTASSSTSADAKIYGMQAAIGPSTAALSLLCSYGHLWPESISMLQWCIPQLVLHFGREWHLACTAAVFNYMLTVWSTVMFGKLQF
jgi:hypothetical protein